MSSETELKKVMLCMKCYEVIWSVTEW